MPHEVEQKALSEYLAARSLKHTKQRAVILDAFLNATGHITSEELYGRVRGKHPNIGYTTVYRTMRLLCDAGLAHERHFEGGVTCYEIEHEHHDHLVCVRCGKIEEFECAMIEDSQQEIAGRYGYLLVRHRHELYGYCPACNDLPRT
jgi:Fur family ferric uptake transcriptional regulator